MTLSETIIHWMKEELPLAHYSAIGDVVTFGIRETYGNQDRILFTVSVGPTSMTISGCGLSEHMTVESDKVVFGKWGFGTEVYIADPKFFNKMTYIMTMVARVVTMGWFSPEGRHAPKKKKRKKNVDSKQGTGPQQKGRAKASSRTSNYALRPSPG